MIKNGQKKATNAGQREILGKVVMVKAKPAKTLLMALRLSFLPIFVNLFRIVSHRAFGDKLLRTAYSFPVFYPHAFSNELLRHALRALHQGGPPHRGVPPPSEIERPLADQKTPIEGGRRRRRRPYPRGRGGGGEEEERAGQRDGVDLISPGVTFNLVMMDSSL